MNYLTHPATLILIGIIVGVYSGLLGLGGGTIMIPIMIFLLGLNSKQAIGTSLAIMILGIIPAVVEHYRNGHIKLNIGLWIFLGFLAGSLFGAKIAAKLNSETLRLLFGFIVVFVAAYTIFGKQYPLRGLLLAAIPTAAAILLFFFVVVGESANATQPPSAPSAPPPKSSPTSPA